MDSRHSTSHLRYDLATGRASIREQYKTTNVSPPAKRKASLSLLPSPARPFPAPRFHEMYPSSLFPAPSSSMPLSPPVVSPPSMPYSALLLSGSINHPIEICDDEDDPIVISDDENDPIETINNEDDPIVISDDENDPIEISDDQERRWPEDFFVDEVVPGLQEYEKTTEGQHKAVFERRYPGITYSHTTVFDQVKKWKEAPPQFKDACLGGERIRWSVFARRLKKGKMLASVCY